MGGERRVARRRTPSRLRLAEARSARAATSRAACVSTAIHQSGCCVRTFRQTRSGARCWRRRRALAPHRSFSAGPVWLLVERRATGVEVARLRSNRHGGSRRSFSPGGPMQAALDNSRRARCRKCSAEHLAAGRFVAFELSGAQVASRIKPAARGRPHEHHPDCFDGVAVRQSAQSLGELDGSIAFPTRCWRFRCGSRWPRCSGTRP